MSYNDALEELRQLGAKKLKEKPVSKKTATTTKTKPKTTDRTSGGRQMSSTPPIPSQPAPTTRSALETAIRLPGLAAEGAVNALSFGLIPKALPPAETPIEKLWAGAGSGSGSLGAGGIVRAGAQKVLPVAKSAASVASTLPTSVKVGAGIGTGAIGVPIVQGTTTPDDTNRSFLQQTGASLRAGVGDVASTAGGTAKWLGAEELGENLSETGQNIREGYETQYSKPFTWKSFFEPEFYSTTVSRAVPFTASLIPAMVAGYKGAGSLVGKTSLSPFQKTVVSALGGAGVARPLESALEAGGVYDEAIARGMDEQQADAAANEVFKKNIALGGLDAAQLAVAFAPAPFKAAGTAGKVAMGAGRIGAGGLTEAGEEGYQEVIQRQALGDEVAFDDAMKQSMAVGGIFGAGMGGFGVVNDMIHAKVSEKTGIPQEQLNDNILDTIAENQQGKQIIEEATQEAVAGYVTTAGGTPGSNTDTTVGRLPQVADVPQQQVTEQQALPGIETPAANITGVTDETFLGANQYTEQIGQNVPIPTAEKIAQQPEIPTPTHSEILPGDTVTLKSTGKPLAVVDTSERTLLTVRNELGKQFRIGRKAVNVGGQQQVQGQPPAAQKQYQPIEPVRGEPVPGDTVTLKNSGKPLTVIDTPNRIMLTVQNDKGKQFRIGRKAVNIAERKIPQEQASVVKETSTSQVKPPTFTADKKQVNTAVKSEPATSGVFGFAAGKEPEIKRGRVSPAKINTNDLKRLSPKATREISENIAKSLKTVLRVGRVQRHAKGAEGTFDTHSGAGRLKRKRLASGRVVLHELGHGLEFNGGFKPHTQEMTALAAEYYPGKIPKGREASEGLAEYLWLYFTDNQLARDKAPKTTEQLEAFLDANSALRQAFDEALSVAQKDTASNNPMLQIGNDILRPSERSKVNIGEEYQVPQRKRLTFKLADYTIPLRDMYNAAMSRGFTGKNPARLAAISGTAREQAVSLFETIPRDKSGRFLVPGQKRSLKAIVEAIDKAYAKGVTIEDKKLYGVELFDRIYHAMRYHERYERGFEDAPREKGFYDELVADARENYPDIVAAIDEYSNILSETVLRHLVHGDVISEETATNIRKGSTTYLPLYHSGTSSGISSEESGKRRMAGQPVKRYSGHSGATMTFLEATMLKLTDTLSAVETNRVMLAIEDALRAKGMGLFGEIIDRPTVIKMIGRHQLEAQLDGANNVLSEGNPDDDGRIVRLFMPGNIRDIGKSEPVIIARHGDKQVYMRLARDVYESVLSMTPLSVDWVGKALLYIAQVSRFGALFNPRFIANAFARDVVGSNIQSQTQTRSMVWGYLKGAAESAGLDPELMSLYIQSGAYGSSVQEGINSLLRSTHNDGLMSTAAPGWKRTATGAFVRVVKTPHELLRVMEEASRVSEFEAMLKRDLKGIGLTIDDLKKGKIPDSLAGQVEDILVDAAHASREVVVNFGLHGTHEGFRKYARTVPFLQGGIQGIYREYRQVRDKPLETLKRWTIYVLPITLMSWALMHNDDRYRDMDSRSRDTYWWFDVDGFMVGVAKPYGYALPDMMLERFLDWTFNTDDTTRRKPLEDIDNVIKRTVGVPTTSMPVQAILDLMSNKNYFGSAIVPMREMNSMPEFRYGPGNSKAAIKMAGVAARLMAENGPSPRQIDYFMEASFGGVGELAMNILSKGVGAVSPGSPGSEKRAGIEYAPVVGSLIYGPAEGGSRVTDKFYKDKSHAGLMRDKVKNNVKNGLPAAKGLSEHDVLLVRSWPALNAISNDLADLRAQQRDINSSEEYTPTQKRLVNIRVSWVTKVACGYLYRRPVPEPPKELDITDADIQDILNYYDNLTAKAVQRAKK